MNIKDIFTRHAEWCKQTKTFEICHIVFRGLYDDDMDQTAKRVEAAVQLMRDFVQEVVLDPSSRKELASGICGSLTQYAKKKSLSESGGDEDHPLVAIRQRLYSMVSNLSYGWEHYAGCGTWPVPTTNQLWEGRGLKYRKELLAYLIVRMDESVGFYHKTRGHTWFGYVVCGKSNPRVVK